MTSRMQSPVVRRPSVPLTEDDDRNLATFRGDAALRQALSDLSGEDVVDGEPSEAAFLHAVLVAGQRAVREVAEAAGYAMIAADQEASSAGRRAEARRRRPSWADEA